MAEITFKGRPLHTNGELPHVGDTAKDFTLVAADLSEVQLGSFGKKKKVLSVVPSLDTPTCATSAKKFNEKAGKLDNVAVLVISQDLPFAQKRFCDTEGLKNVTALSSFRSNFPHDYGLSITEGPLRGLNSRAIIILDEENRVIYTEQVHEVTEEPDYASALEALKQ